MFAQGPLDNLNLEELPEPTFFVKKPTALVAAEKNFKADSAKIEKQVQDVVKHALPSDVGADVSSKSVRSNNQFVLNGLQSVANQTGKSAIQEGGEASPEIRTMMADGKNWACTPFEPSDVSNPAALSLVQTSMPTSSGSDMPALPNPSSAFPSTANDLSGKSGRRLLQNQTEPSSQVKRRFYLFMIPMDITVPVVAIRTSEYVLTKVFANAGNYHRWPSSRPFHCPRYNQSF